MKLVLSVLVVFCLLSLRPALSREWTDSSGTYKIEADLVKLDGETVHLKKPDGAIIKVPVDKLCDDDRTFVRQQTAAPVAAPKADSETGTDTSQPASAQDAPAIARTWTNAEGTRKIKAEFLRVEGDLVHLKKVDGTVTKVPLEKLSQDDREFAQQKAIDECTEAIRLDPKSAEAYFSRGRIYSLKGDREKARDDYTRAIFYNRDYVDAYLHRSECYLASGDFVKAIADCTRVIRLEPQNVPAYCIRGWAETVKGDYDKAIADCNKAISLDAKYAPAYCTRGQVYSAKREHAKAIADFAEAIRVDPKNAMTYQCRAGTYLDKGDLDPAITDCDEAIHLNPKSAGAYNLRGLAYTCKGDTSKAASDFVEAKRLGSVVLKVPSILLSRQLGGAEPPEIGPLKMDLRPADLNKILSRKLGREVEDPEKYATNTSTPDNVGFTDWDRVESDANDGKPLARKHQIEFREFYLSNVKTEYGFPTWVDRVTCYFAAERLYKIQLGYAFCQMSAETGQAGQRLFGRPVPAVSKKAAEEAERALLRRLAATYKVREEPFADMIQLDSVPADAELTAVFGDPKRVEAGRQLLLQRGEAPDAINNSRIVQGRFVMPYSYRVHGKSDPDVEYERLFENDSLVVAVDTSRWDVIARGANGEVDLARRFVRVTYIWRPFVKQLGRAYTTAKLQELEEHEK